MPATQKIKTPSYYGGKSPNHRNGKWVASLLPKDTNVPYVEPFAGMLGVLFQRRPATAELVNDTNEHLINWWRMVRDAPDDLARQVALTPRSRAEYLRAWRDCYAHKGTPLERARDYFISINQSFFQLSNARQHAPWSKSLTGPLSRWTGDELAPLAARLFSVQIECKSALEVLDYTANKDLILYADPPYRTADTTPYGDFDIDWDDLTRLLKLQTGRVAVSGYADEWDHLHWRKHHFPTHTGGTIKGRPSQRREECLWTNY